VPLPLLLLPSLLDFVGLAGESSVSRLGVGHRSVVFVADDDDDGVEGITTSHHIPRATYCLTPLRRLGAIVPPWRRMSLPGVYSDSSLLRHTW
jgi:hypothetical protein